MLTVTYAIWLAAIGAGPPRVEPGHAKNSVYMEVLDRGLKAEGQTVTLPEPRLGDGQAADDQRRVARCPVLAEHSMS